MTERVFFLGAGFSKAIDQTFYLLPELSQYISERMCNTQPPINRTHLPELFNKIPFILRQNIEDLLVYLFSDAPWKDMAGKSADLALFYEVIDEISNYFLNKASSPSIINASLWNDFSKKIRDSKEYSFISLNYDTLVENILYKDYSECGTDLYGYPFVNINNRSRGIFTEKSEKKSIYPVKLIKLHGSANWFYAGSSTSDIIYYFPWSQECKNEYRIGLTPFIVPPIADKSHFYNHIILQHLWKRAFFDIAIAQEIYIIGYSFPQSDLAIRQLFQLSFDTFIPGSTTVYVVNKATENDLRINYDTVFGKDNPHINYDYCGSDNVVERFIREKILKEKE